MMEIAVWASWTQHLAFWRSCDTIWAGVGFAAFSPIENCLGIKIPKTKFESEEWQSQFELQSYCFCMSQIRVVTSNDKISNSRDEV